MSSEELIEEFTRAQRYRSVLVVAAVIGIVASAVVGMSYSLGAWGDPDAGVAVARTRDSSVFGFLVLPFAASMVIGGGIYNALLFFGKRRRR